MKIQKTNQEKPAELTSEIVDFPVFKTIKLGTHKNVDKLHESLKENGFQISSQGSDILAKTDIAKSETEINLCLATVKELTGKNKATNREINNAIRTKGYQLCPAEVGPQLRLQYPDQSYEERNCVAMEPIDIDIFRVDNVGDKRWLRGYYGHPNYQWRGDARFVFVSHK